MVSVPGGHQFTLKNELKSSLVWEVNIFVVSADEKPGSEPEG